MLWDLDGTLLDSERLWCEAVAEFIAEHGRTLAGADRSRLIGATVPEVLRLMVHLAGLRADAATLRRAQSWLTRRLARRYVSPVPWRPGAQAALRTVRAAGLRSALVTNTCRELADVALSGMGREYFDASVSGDDVRNGKPAPDPYLRAAEIIGIPTTECVAIEDSPTGALAARAAGCGLIVVPCDLTFTIGDTATMSASLEDLTVADLERALEAVSGGPCGAGLEETSLPGPLSAS